MAASRQAAPARVAQLPKHDHSEPGHRHGWQSGAAAPASGAGAIRSLPALGGEADAEAEAQAGSSGRPSWKTIFKVLSPLAFLPQFGGVIAAGLGGALEPKEPGVCDIHGMPDQVLNVVTSLPYIGVGVWSARKRRFESGRLWGASVAGVGVASCIFHSTHGSWRTAGRRLDMWCIAACTSFLSRAVFPDRVPTLLTAASLALTPFYPKQIMGANTLAMEVAYLRRAREDPSMRRPQLAHSLCAVAGLAAFAAEDLRPLPFIHSLWHAFSVAATFSTNYLLADVEARYEAAAAAAAEAGLAATARPLKL